MKTIAWIAILAMSSFFVIGGAHEYAAWKKNPAEGRRNFAVFCLSVGTGSAFAAGMLSEKTGGKNE